MQKSKPAKPRVVKAQTHASRGNASNSITPKDLPPDGMIERDVSVRQTTSPDPEVREEALLDDAIESTFPASDPVAIPTIAEAEKHYHRISEQKPSATPIPAHKPAQHADSQKSRLREKSSSSAPRSNKPG